MAIRYPGAAPGRRAVRSLVAAAASLLSAARCQAEDLGAIRSEILELAAREDGTASPENIALMARARGLLGRVASVAVADGDLSTKAWDLLEEIWTRRERNVAMEAAMTILGTRRDDGARRLLGSLPAADAAVRRQAMRFLAVSGRDPTALFPEVRAALAREDDPETARALVSLAAGVKSKEAARAILASSPPPPSHEGRRGSPRSDRDEDPHAAIREFIVEALAGQETDAVREWLRAEAFKEAGAPGQLWTAARVAALRKDEGARPALESLLETADDGVATEAISALAAIGLEPSRRTMLSVARSERTPPRVACAAALALAPTDRGAAVEEVLDLSRRPEWERRVAAAGALAELADDELPFRRCLQLLDDTNREVRAAAFRSLRSFRRKEAIPALAAMLAPLRSPDTGLAASYLEWATGQRLGRDRDAWLRWWKGAEPWFLFPAGASPTDARSIPTR